MQGSKREVPPPDAQGGPQGAPEGPARRRRVQFAAEPAIHEAAAAADEYEDDSPAATAAAAAAAAAAAGEDEPSLADILDAKYSKTKVRV